MLRAAETIQRTDTGRQRRGNEDCSFARAPLFVVADGMGGAQAGEVASRIAVEAFAQGLPDAGGAEERLATRVREANSHIYERAHSEHDLAGMGTTLTAAYLEDTNVAIAHVGDSRAYLFRGGQLKRLTRDHSLVDELVREGKLTEEQAAEHPQRSIITRALGPEATVAVDTWSYPVRADDVLLLCSDGLTSMLSEARITQILQEGPNLEQAADRLIDAANAAGGRDNITVVLFRVEDTDGDDGLAQPTMVAPPPSASGGEEPQPAPEEPPAAVPPPAEGLPSSTTATAAPAPATTRTITPAPLARTQGRPAPAPTPRRGAKYAKPIAAVIATVIVLFLVGGGGYVATRQLYFIGTNSNGIVTIYRGLPYDLPAGIRLYETYYTSGVPAVTIPADRRKSLLNNHLRSQKDAVSLMRSVELGQLSQ